MDIFVINLDKDVNRRISMSKNFKELGINFEFFIACDGRALTSTELTQLCDKDKTIRRIGRSLLPGEIGCALSHVRVYQEIIKRKLPCALILEDDVILPLELFKVLESVIPNISTQKPEVIMCGYQHNGKTSHEIKLTDKYSLYTYSPKAGAFAYIINNSAAKILSKYLFPISDVADCWNRLYQHRVVDFKLIKPVLIKPNVEELSSSITLELWKAKDSSSVNALKKTIDVLWITNKTKRLFWKCIDFIMAIYDRKVRPYNGNRE